MGKRERRAYLEAIPTRYRRASKAGKNRHSQRVLRGMRLSRHSGPCASSGNGQSRTTASGFGMALCAENEEELKTFPLKSVVLSLLDVPVYRHRIKEAVYLLAEVLTIRDEMGFELFS